MKILMLINGLYPETIGGIEKVGADLAELLAKKNEVLVYTSFRKDLPVHEIRHDFTIKRVKSSYDLKLRLPLGVRSVNILQHLRKEKAKPDIILSMSLGYGFVCFLSKKLFKIPYLMYALGSDWYIARDKRIKGRGFRLGVERCDTLLTQTNIIKSEVLERFPKSRIEVIPNGIAIPNKRASGEKIVSFGRLHEVKGIRFLIEAVRKMKGCPEVVIAGSGPEETELKKMAEGLNVKFAGRIPDSEVEELFLQAKLFMLPSLSEGLPQVMLEAMSYGVPVIATKVGGIPDVIDHGKTGFLVEPGDSEDLRKHMELLLGDERMHANMSDQCLMEVKNYSWDHVLKKIEKVMERSISSGKS